LTDKKEQDPVGTVKDLFTQAAWEKLDVRGSTKVYLGTPPAAQPVPNCTRSHPHEKMDAMCELRTEIARLTNENARLKAQLAPVERALELQGLVKEFFEKYLNRVEESDEGKEFNPITIGCCRAHMLEPLNNLLDKMAELSGTEARRST